MVLSICVGVALILLSVVNGLTRGKITQAHQAWMLENLSSVLPEGPFDANPMDSREQHIAPALGSAEPLEIYTAYKNEQAAAIVLEVVAPDGYSGQIKLLLGLHVDGTIIAARVIEHKETPGLGDGIELRKSNWIHQFENLSTASSMPSHWALKNRGGEFDGLTGATITSSAVVRAIHRALNWYDAHRDTIFETGSQS